MIESCQNKRALLLGNGINLLNKEQSISWGALLEDLKKEYRIDVDLENVFKPFPLAFEEMLHRKGGKTSFDRKLKTLKIGIKESIENQLRNKDGYNKYHSRILEVEYNDILTTNYDYGLQKSVISNFYKIKKNLAVNKQENKFSLKRCYKIPNILTKVWHIHGEIYDSRTLSEGSRYYHEESIMIGYEQYASYLEKIQENFKGKKGSQKSGQQSLMMRIKNQVTGKFWTDIFFTHNVDIVGQGFDFSENHLWWLINKRANYIRDYSKTHEVTVNNEIRFYYPVISGENSISLDHLGSIEDLLWKKIQLIKLKL